MCWCMYCVCVCSIVGKIGLVGLLRCLPYTREFWLSEWFLLLVTNDASFVCSFVTRHSQILPCRIMSVLCAFSWASIKNGPAVLWLRPNFVGWLVCDLRTNRMYVGWHSGVFVTLCLSLCLVFITLFGFLCSCDYRFLIPHIPPVISYLYSLLYMYTL